VGNVFDAAISDRVPLSGSRTSPLGECTTLIMCFAGGLAAISITFGCCLFGFFDQWLRNLLSQSMLQETCLDVRQKVFGVSSLSFSCPYVFLAKQRVWRVRVLLSSMTTTTRPRIPTTSS
jgi:hypothetical protein